MRQIPTEILTAAVALLQPFSPGLTGEGLTEALKQGGVVSAPHLERPLTVAEAAEFLSVSCKTIRRYCKSGRLRAKKVGPSPRIDPESLRALAPSAAADVAEAAK